MYPYIEIFGRNIASYGLMAALGCFVAFGFVFWICPRYGANRDDELYLIAFVTIFTLAGARLFYLIPHISELWEYSDVIFSSMEAFMKYISTGFVFYGGFFCGAVGAIVYARFFKSNALPLVQAFVPAIPLFHFFGRIGCFLAGCCYGIQWEGPLSVTFEHSIGAPNGVPLLPIQLIEAAANLLTFGILLAFDQKTRKPLQNLGLYLMIYSVERFVLEFFRGDLIRGFFLNVSTSQWISLILLPAGLWLFFGTPEKNVLVRMLSGSTSKAENVKNM